jgi:hypothetical protein
VGLLQAGKIGHFIDTCSAALHLVLRDRLSMVSLAGRPGNGASGGERQARGERPDHQLGSRDHGYGPFASGGRRSAAQSQQNPSRLRFGCHLAAAVRNPASRRDVMRKGVLTVETDDAAPGPGADDGAHPAVMPGLARPSGL